MPFLPGNKVACRKDKLSEEEVRERKRIRSAEYRKTHPYKPQERSKYYKAAKVAFALKPEKPIKDNGQYAPSKQKFAWDECPENLLNLD